MTIKNTGLTLTNYSILEAESPFLPFYPTWYNTHEASLFKKANDIANVDSWLFKRFGVDESVLKQERVRKTSYREWVNTLNQTCLNVSKQLGPKELFRLNQEKTAFFYIDSWGETSTLENVNSWRDSLTIDILPKAIIKQFHIKDITSKIRGERNALLLGMLAAQDLMESTDYDNVIICGQYRAHPIHVFSELQTNKLATSKKQMTNNTQEVVERVCCLLFRKSAQQGINIKLDGYSLLADRPKERLKELKILLCEKVDEKQLIITHTPLSSHKILVEQLRKFTIENRKINLAAINQLYADSGCLNVASAIEYFSQQSDVYPQSKLWALDGQWGLWQLSLSKKVGRSSI
ncbi:hypothetical protein [Thorsellia kenyensis]|uniref:Uncharacterized protein n=1 Tax=Thorsellia kenyensis TaxID=1549888 RepID=A0ABV6CDA2_9GAMM